VLHVHRAERRDTLATALADVLRDPLPDPFATEVVAVPARGVERLAGPAALARPRAPAPPGRTACAPASRSPPPARSSPPRSARPPAATPADDPWQPARAAVAAAGGPRRVRRRAVVRRARPAPRRRRRAAARGRAPVRRAVRRPTPRTDPRTGRGLVGGGRRPRATSPGSRSCGGGCAAASASRARPSGLPASSRAARRPRPVRPPARVSLFGPHPPGSTAQTAGGSGARWPSTATSHLVAAHPIAQPLWDASAPSRPTGPAAAAARSHGRRPSRTSLLSSPWARRPASCSWAGLARAPSDRWSTGTPRRTRRPTLARGGLQRELRDEPRPRCARCRTGGG
jgi:hypothetical protein